MKKDRQKLEDALSLGLVDYANDNKVLSDVVAKLMEKGISRGKATGMFTQAIAFSYVSQTELCLFTKYLYESTHEHKINPEHFFNEIEIQQSETYQQYEEERTNRITLHNVDQINKHQWLCTKETYQAIAKYFENGLLVYNPKTQRQPLKRKVSGRIIEVININNKKINEIKEEMIAGTFNTNAIIFNIRKIIGQEKFRYNSKDRTLTIEADNETTFVDIIDGFHRLGAILKATEEKPDIDRLTSIYIYHVDEEKARQVIRQESKATPIDEQWIDLFDVSNPNMEVAKSINSKQRMNEMFNRIGLDSAELRRENKLVTFETLSKAIEYVYDLKDKPFIEAQNVEKLLIELFNVVIGVKRPAFTDTLAATREFSYLADNNTFIGYIALGEQLRQLFPDDWQDKLMEILSSIDFTKPSERWKQVGLENNINLSTIKKVSEAFRSIAREWDNG